MKNITISADQAEKAWNGQIFHIKTAEADIFTGDVIHAKEPFVKVGENKYEYLAGKKTLTRGVVYPAAELSDKYTRTVLFVKSVEESGDELVLTVARLPLEAVDASGTDIDVSMISSCKSHSMTECENTCERYYGCQTVAYANDVILECEQIKDDKEKSKNAK